MHAVLTRAHAATLHSQRCRPSFATSSTDGPQHSTQHLESHSFHLIVGPAFENASSSILVRHFSILFLFIIHVPPLKYFYLPPFHSLPGDMTTMVGAKKHQRGFFFVAAVLAGIYGEVVMSEMLAFTA